jgi:hypothetical protein
MQAGAAQISFKASRGGLEVGLLEISIAVAVVVLLGGAFYLRRKMPWPFEYEGRKYRRMPNGTFQDANKKTVTDAALVPQLTKAYEAAKYGTGELQAWESDNS